MALAPIAEKNQDATIYVGGLDEKVTEDILWELFVQAGPVVDVNMPKDRVTQEHQGFGFIEFMSEEDADYAIKIMNMIKLYGKPIRASNATSNQKSLDIGANLFIGNLDGEVDEKLLFDTFSSFGVILQTPKIMRDTSTGNPKGYAFISFGSFEAADSALEAMHGQFLCNRAITVQYAFKKDTKGQRHGSAAERLLAKNHPTPYSIQANTKFADHPPEDAPKQPKPAPPPPQPPTQPQIMHPPPPIAIRPPPPPPPNLPPFQPGFPMHPMSGVPPQPNVLSNPIMPILQPPPPQHVPFPPNFILPMGGMMGGMPPPPNSFQ
ncbi:hypothetical protein SNEBB_005508 [Seison nebaliae]|nr:hypothetical protein SNEBB_005508 [Seison nebaliae]